MNLTCLIRRADDGTDTLHVAWSDDQIAAQPDAWQSYQDYLQAAVDAGDLAGWGAIPVTVAAQSATAAVKRAAKQAGK